DIVVSNPPYIAKSEKPFMDDTVAEYDPEIALFAEENGLAAYQSIMSRLPHVLQPNGIVALEIGYQQGKAVKQMMERQFPQQDVHILPDINQKERIVTVEMKERSL